MPESYDDLDAVRKIVDTLSPFEAEDQKRITRWAYEKLGLEFEITAPQHPVTSQAIPVSEIPAASAAPSPTPTTPTPNSSITNIKSFVEEKSPNNDMQFATTVAYFYAFEAPEQQTKEEIGYQDLQESCRLTGKERLAQPGQTLRNAAHNGLLDKGSAKGTYKINTVGENLVALTLPSTDGGGKPKTPRKRTRKSTSKKTTNKTPQKAVKKATQKNSRKK